MTRYFIAVEFSGVVLLILSRFSPKDEVSLIWVVGATLFITGALTAVASLLPS